jgi:hypothetical protein
MRRLALFAVVLLAGCGGAGKPKRAASRPTSTPSPTPALTVPAATATPVATPANPRAQAKLLRLLKEHAQDGGRQCLASEARPRGATAALTCDYDGDSVGSYALFRTTSAMRSYFARTRAAKPIRRGACSRGTVWWRGRRKGTSYEGRISFGLAGGRKVLIWSDNSELVVGVIRARTASNAEMCAIWRTRV